MLQREHSAIFSTTIKLLFSIKTIFQWLLKTGLTVGIKVVVLKIFKLLNNLLSSLFVKMFMQRINRMISYTINDCSKI